MGIPTTAINPSKTSEQVRAFMFEQMCNRVMGKQPMTSKDLFYKVRLKNQGPKVPFDDFVKEHKTRQEQFKNLRKSFYKVNNPPVYKYDNLGFWSAPKEPVTKRIQAGLKNLAKNLVKLLRK